jgi:hypothetical protein
MFKDELEMLQCHLEALEGCDATVVLVEAPHTHRAVPKPLVFAENKERFAAYDIRHVVDDWDPDRAAPWNTEHHQRNAAWKVIDKEADDGDAVIIGDVDEIPSRELLDFLPLWATVAGEWPLSVAMKTYVFACDWQVAVPVPEPCVVATVRYLRKRAACGEYLAEVRDDRSRYPVFRDNGGWHLSWLGGPERQREKLLNATCHVELLDSPEGNLIASGERYRTAQDGGGLAVIGVDVDSSWPPFIYERRCPPSWFRPRTP